MAWAGLIGVIVLLAIPGLYWAVGALRKNLDDDERARLEGTGEAHSFADLSMGHTHYRLEAPDKTGAQAPLVVLVHGFSTPSFVYDDYFAPLTAAGFQAVAYDLYGRGFSDRPPGAYGVETYVRQLEDLIHFLGEKNPVHLVGYSMGGPIVTRFVDRHPEKVASITLIAPAGLARPTGQGSSSMTAPLIGEWVFRVLLGSVLRRRFSDGFDYAPDPEDFAAKFARQFRYRGLDHALLDTVRAFGRGEFNVNYAAPASANVPVQAFFSEDDSVIPIESAARLEKTNPRAEVHRFADGDHAIGYGKSGEIADGIIRFARTTQDS